MRGLLAWLPPEPRFFLAATRRDARPDELAALITPGFRWSVIESLTHREHATVALVRSLRALPAGVVPAELLRALAAAAMMTEFRMRCLENGLRQAADVLARARVAVVLLKGAALGLTVYPSFTDRVMVDLDLLVSPENHQRAEAALRVEGWQPAYAQTTQPFYDRHQHGVPLVAPGLGGARLEVHSRLFHDGGPFGLTAADLFRDATPVTVDGRPAFVPSPPHSLLYLCLHFAWSHGMTRGLLRAIQDLDALWRAGHGADAGFAALARDAGVLASLRPPRPAWWLDILERHFTGVAGFAPVACPSASLERMLWSAGVLPGWSGHGRQRPWTAGDDWAATTPELTRDGERPRSWSERVGRLGRYATALLRP